MINWIIENRRHPAFQAFTYFLYNVTFVFLILVPSLGFGQKPESSSYRLDLSVVSSGDGSPSSIDYALPHTNIGDPFYKITESGNYRIIPGYIPMLNSAPVLMQKIPNFYWRKNKTLPKAFDLDNYFIDPEGDEIFYSVSGNTEIDVFIDANNEVSFDPAGFIGVEKVVFMAIDEYGNVSYSNTVTLLVWDPSINNPPILDPLDDIQMYEGETIHVIPSAFDVDGDFPLTYTYGWPLDETGHYTAPYDAAGVYTVKITVSDPEGASDTAEFTLRVHNTNRPPVIETIDPVTVNEGEVAAVYPNVSDPDGDRITISYSSPFDSEGLWRTLHTSSEGSPYIATVTAFDGYEYATQDVTINVLDENTTPLVSLSCTPTTIDPSDWISISVVVTNPDEDDCNLVLEADSSEIYNGPVTDLYQTDYNGFSAVGDHTITAIVDDGVISTSKTVPIDVNDSSEDKAKNVAIAGDFNGDGFVDVGMWNKGTGRWRVGFSKQGALSAYQTWLTWKPSSGAEDDWSPIGGDFNGDGLADAGTFNKSNGEFHVALNTGSSFETPSLWKTIHHDTNDVPITGDFNGDGLTDAGVYNRSSGNADVALGDGNIFGSTESWITGYHQDTSNAIPILGDFNGDSLTDLGVYRFDGHNWYIAVSCGSSFIDEGQWLTGYPSGSQVPSTADYNEDGITDAGYYENGTWNKALSDGSSFTDSGTWLSGFGDSDDSAQTSDFNGDNLVDAAIFDKNGNGVGQWKFRLSSGDVPDLLSEIDNGVGGKTEITYTDSTRSENKFLPFPMQLVSEVHTVDTKPGSEPQEIYGQLSKFEGGYYNPEDREFRGFRKTTITDPISGNYAESYFYQGWEGGLSIDPRYNGSLKGQVEKVFAFDKNSLPMSETFNTYNVLKIGEEPKAVEFVQLIKTESTVYERGKSLSVRNNFLYDGIGNILFQANEGDLSVTGDGKRTKIDYDAPYTEGYNATLHTWMSDENGTKVEEKWFEYDDKGNLTRQISWLEGAPSNPETSFQYDDYGNTTHVTNAKGHTVVTTYDSIFHAFPETITNELGHLIEYTYNWAFGLVTSITDANGQKTSTDYDTLGRKIADRNVDTEIVTSYSYPDWNTLITTQQIGASTFQTIEYSDGLGRNYKTISSGEDGTNPRNVVTEKKFNERGHVLWESLPHYEGVSESDITYLRYEYDIKGRVTKVESDFPGVAYDSEARTEYVSPLVKKVYDAKNRAKTYRTDVYDNPVEVIEHTSAGSFSTHYEYDIEGNLIKVTDSHGNETIIEYDTLGRKKELEDPDTGKTEYTYDNMGNLLTQTDARNLTTTFEYDTISRVIRKSYSDSTPEVNYTYDTSTLGGFPVGRLSTVTDGTGTTRLQYDNEGRIVRTIRNIDGTNYQFITDYDKLGRVTRNEYPDLSSVHYSYDVNSGLLEKVSGAVDGSPVDFVSDMQYEAKGQLLGQNFGNGVSTGYEYHPDNLLSRIHTLSATAGDIQDLHYTFDRVGNISQILDKIHGYAKHFQYDEINRLIYADGLPDGAGGTPNTMRYAFDAIGNIMYKSSVGRYEYSGIGAGPHAVTKAGDDYYTYDETGNMSSGRGRTMQWNAAGQLTQVEKAGNITSFEYNHSGDRVKKTTSEEIVTYIGSLYEIRDKTPSGGEKKIVKNIFAGQNRICSIEKEGANPEEIFYSHPDHLGSSNVSTDASGNVVTHLEYNPFGTPSVSEGTHNEDYKFTGKELDASTELYYYSARYYDAHLGRFISADSIVQAPLDPQSLNRYSYCRNNPLVYSDPSGNFWWFIIPVIIGAIIGGITAAQQGGNVLQGILMGAAVAAVSAIAGAFIAPIASAIGSGLFQATLPILGGPLAGALGTAAEFAITGFVSAFAGGLVTGDIRSAFKSAAQSAGINAIIGGIIGFTRFSGIQEDLHGLDPEQEYKKAAEAAIKKGDTEALNSLKKVEKGAKQAKVWDGVKKSFRIRKWVPEGHLELVKSEWKMLGGGLPDSLQITGNIKVVEWQTTYRQYGHWEYFGRFTSKSFMRQWIQHGPTRIVKGAYLPSGPSHSYAIIYRIDTSPPTSQEWSHYKRFNP